ncbi:hypothetical protein BASA81_007119 [Batrachochytrium salamandrivorans]|nr:hypothetical protein BASA81_007119 [Batrachochytrium salamandrivorans]
MDTIGAVPKLDEVAELANEYGDDSARVRWYKFLHIHRVILFFAVLMLIDVVLLVITLILEGVYPECHLIESKCECHGSSNSSLDTCTRVCLAPPHEVEQTIDAMNIISLIILVVFLVEVVIQVWCVGLHRFVRHPFLIIDLVVIVASLAIEIFVQVHLQQYDSDSTNAELDVQAVSVALLLVSRSWRLVRISHSTLTEAHEYYESKVEELKEEIARLKQEKETALE